MGKRPVNSTKGGKFMNPTDQARKVARKRELKRNKKLRQMVRAAAIKGKDPKMIVLELENLDAVEYDPLNVPHLTEVMMKDKRKKLLENFLRISAYYQKEDPDRHTEMKETLARYESKRREKQRYFEAVRAAQRVTIDDSIPMPADVAPPFIRDLRLLAAERGKSQLAAAAAQGGTGERGKGILRDKSRAACRRRIGRRAPGPPPGPPPPISVDDTADDDNDDDDDEDDADAAKKRAIRIALEREKQLRDAENLVEEALATSDRLRSVTFTDETLSSISLPAAKGPLLATSVSGVVSSAALPPLPIPPKLTPPSVPMMPPPSAPLTEPSAGPRVHFRSPVPPVPPLRPPAPPLASLFPLRPPLGPPPGPPTGPPPAGIVRAFASGLLVRQFGSALENTTPRGIRTALPTTTATLQGQLLQQQQQQQQQQLKVPEQKSSTAPFIVAAADLMLLDQSKREPRRQGDVGAGGAGAGTPTAPTPTTQKRVDGATIVATPVLRKIRADVTKFTPTAVKVKRARQPAAAAAKIGNKVGGDKPDDATTVAAAAATVTEDPRMKAEFTDKAYENFMKEIEQLM